MTVSTTSNNIGMADSEAQSLTHFLTVTLATTLEEYKPMHSALGFTALYLALLQVSLPWNEMPLLSTIILVATLTLLTELEACLSGREIIQKSTVTKNIILLTSLVTLFTFTES